MNLQQLRTLIAIEENARFADAADAVHLTPAAVSQQMRALEDTLGVALFDRTTRPPRLNAHGRDLVREARDVLARFDALEERARAPGEIAGTLTIGSASGMTSALFPRALTALRDRYPMLRFRIVEAHTDQLIARVRRRELDAALITEPLLPEPGMQMLPIMAENLMVVAPRSLAVRGWRRILESRPFLRLNRTLGIGALIDATLRREGLVVDEAMVLDNSESIVDLVAAGLGVGIVPAGRLRNADMKKIRAVPLGSPPVQRRVVLLETEDSQRSDLAAILYKELRTLTGDDKAPPTAG